MRDHLDNTHVFSIPHPPLPTSFKYHVFAPLGFTHRWQRDTRTTSSRSNTGQQDKSRCSFSSPLPLHWSVPCVTVLVCSKSIRLATTAAAAAANGAESRPMNVRNHPLLLVCYNGAAWGRTNLIKRARLWNWARAATLLRLLLALLFFVKGCSFILCCLLFSGLVDWM